MWTNQQSWIKTLLYIILFFSIFHSLNELLYDTLLDESTFLSQVIIEVTFIVFIVIVVFVLKSQLNKKYEVEKQLSNIYNSLSITLWSSDPKNDKMVQISPGCEQISGYTQEEFLKEKDLWKKVVHPDDLAKLEAREQLFVNGEPLSHKYRIIHKNGEIKWLYEHTFPIINGDGSLIRVESVVTEITKEEEAAQKIKKLAYFDQLTELPNHQLFKRRLGKEIRTAAETNKQVAIIRLDINRFKYVNDTLGHEFGDLLLREVGARLKSASEQAAITARVNSDEFAIVLAGITDEDTISATIRDIISAFESPIFLGRYEFFMQCTMGISLFPKDGLTKKTLEKHAELALKSAKKQKVSHQFFHESMEQSSKNLITLEADLRKALERNEFELFYQPQICSGSSQVIGVEALIRWKKECGSFVSPAEFIPVAEETGLIIPIGEWVIESAIKQNKMWQEMGYPPITVSVNISIRQFFQQDLVYKIKQALEKYKLNPQYLELEITETMTMDVERAIAILTRLKALGIKISLDDFGTGYSSLTRLKSMPIDNVKIDKSFIKEIANDARDAAIASSIIRMSHSLNLKVVAEGVETIEQFELLARETCDVIQGFLFSPPLPNQKFESLWRNLAKNPPFQLEFQTSEAACGIES